MTTRTPPSSAPIPTLGHLSRRPPPRSMICFAPSVPLRRTCAPIVRLSATSTRPVRMAASKTASRRRVARGIASIAAVGAVLTLCTARAHALAPPSPSPAITAVQQTKATLTNPLHSQSTLPLGSQAAAPRVAFHTPAHMPSGHEAANFLRSRGLSDSLVVLLISALPVVELRGGIPVGFLLGVPPLQTFLLSVIGNMLPVIPVIALLRLPLVQRIASPVLDRARKKAESVSNSSSQAKALALFVGVPLPGTGAWTGCLVAFVLDMPFRSAFFSLLVGVVSAAFIVTSLCLMGRTGGAIAASVLLGTGLLSLLSDSRRSPVPTDDDVGR